MSKIKVVRNIKGTKQLEDNYNLKELNLIEKIQEDRLYSNKENRNLYEENQNYQKANLNLNKSNTNQRTVSRGKLLLKENVPNVLSPLDKRANIVSNFPSNNISKDINNSILNRESGNYTKIIEINNEYAHEFTELRISWNELGVTETFRNYFENVAIKLDTNIRKDYIAYEINNMKKLKEQIQKLSKEIQAREKTILLLNKFDKILSKNEMDKKIKDDIVQTIKNLRILSMNIINHYLRIKESTSHHLINSKFDPETLNKLLFFDGNYVLKMKNDTDFLYNSSMKKYFDFAPESDPFLIAISGPDKETLQDLKNFDNGNIDNNDNNVNNLNVNQAKELNSIDANLINNNDSNNTNQIITEKISVKIPEEIAEMIKNCQFSILQELIYQEINMQMINKIDITSITGKSSVSIRSGKNLKPGISVLTSKNNLNAYHYLNSNLHGPSGNDRVIFPLNNNNININSEKSKNYLGPKAKQLIEGGGNSNSKSKSNSKVVKKNNLRPISDNNNLNNINSKAMPNISNTYNTNNIPEFNLNAISKTPDNKNLQANYFTNNIEMNSGVPDFNHLNNFNKYNLLTNNIINNKKILNFNSYNTNDSNMLNKNLEADNGLLINSNNKNIINKKLGKLDNGITSHERDNTIIETGIELNAKNNININKETGNDFKNIDSFLNDSKMTKKTDISNLLAKDCNNYNYNSNQDALNERNIKIIENIDSLNSPQEVLEPKRITLLGNKEPKLNSELNNLNNNFPERVNLTDVSMTSHKNNTPNNMNNRVIIKEKIFIEDKRNFDNNQNNINNNLGEKLEETEETGRILTKESLVKVSHELEKLRTDVLENHYISSLEKLNNNPIINNQPSTIKIKKNSKEKSRDNINVQNLSGLSNKINPNTNARVELKSSSSTRKVKVVGGNLPPTGIPKGKVNQRVGSAFAKQSNSNNASDTGPQAEGKLNNYANSSFSQNYNNKSNHPELINNLDKSLLQKKKILDYNDSSLADKSINNSNYITNTTNKKIVYIEEKNFERAEAGSGKEGEEADISNLKSTEKSNLDNKTSFECDKGSVLLPQKTNERKKNNINIENKDQYIYNNNTLNKLAEDQDLKNKILQEIKQEEKSENKILTHKLMKNIDRALLSSDEFSIKGDKLGQSQITNTISTRINNLREIKENNRSLNEVFEDKLSDDNDENSIMKNEEKIVEQEIYRIDDNNLKITNLECSSFNEQIDHEYKDVKNNFNKFKNDEVAEEEKLDEKSFRLDRVSLNIKNDKINIPVLESKAIRGSTSIDQTNAFERTPYINRDSESNQNRHKNAFQEHNQNSNTIQKEDIPIKGHNAKVTLTKSEIRRKEESEINNQVSSEPVIRVSTNSLNDLKQVYSRYIQEIDQEQKTIFNISDSVYNYLKGSFPKFIFIEDPKLNKIISISTCNYDSHFSTGIRLVLSSFSTLEPENYFKHAEKIIAYLKTNFPNSEIYIELFYGIQNEKFYINEKLRDVFSKQLKFRWITLENTGTQRIVKYRLVNSEFNLEEILNSKNKSGIENEKEKNLIKTMCENINSLVDVKINTTIAFRECKNDADSDIYKDGGLPSPREFTREETDVNIFPAIFLLSDLINKSGYKVNNDNLRLFSNERTRKIARKFIQSTSGETEEVKDFIEERIQLNDLPDLLKKERELSTALIYITNKFKNVLTFQYDGFLYNKLKFEELEILKDPETECVYYLLRTADENYSLFIGEINEKNNFIQDDNLNKCENFYKLYTGLEQLPSNNAKTILLPVFNFQKSILVENPKFLADIKLEKKNESEHYEDIEDEEPSKCEHYVHKFFQSFSIKFGHDLNYNRNFVLDHSENEIIIEKDFVFALINLEVLSDLNIPSISFNIISKNNWKRA